MWGLESARAAVLTARTGATGAFIAAALERDMLKQGSTLMESSACVGEEEGRACVCECVCVCVCVCVCACVRHAHGPVRQSVWCWSSAGWWSTRQRGPSLDPTWRQCVRAAAPGRGERAARTTRSDPLHAHGAPGLACDLPRELRESLPDDVRAALSDDSDQGGGGWLADRSMKALQKLLGGPGSTQLARNKVRATGHTHTRTRTHARTHTHTLARPQVAITLGAVRHLKATLCDHKSYAHMHFGGRVRARAHTHPRTHGPHRARPRPFSHFARVVCRWQRARRACWRRWRRWLSCWLAKQRGRWRR